MPEFTDITGQPAEGINTVPEATDEQLDMAERLIKGLPIVPPAPVSEPDTAVQKTIETEGVTAIIKDSTQVTPDQPVQPVQPVAQAEPEKMSFTDLLKSFGDSEETPAPAPTTPTTETPLTPAVEPPTWQTEKAEMQEQINKLTKLTEWFDEYSKNPYEFRAKYEPALFKDKFDKVAYVNGKLEEEFGKEFKVIPEDVYTLGTSSNQYVTRQQDLLREAVKYETTADTKIQISEEEAEKVFNDSLETARKSVGIAEKIFTTDIRPIVKTLDAQKVLEYLIKGVYLEARLATIGKTLTEPTSKQAQIESITNLAPNVNTVEEKDIQTLATLFPSRFNKAFGRQ